MPPTATYPSFSLRVTGCILLLFAACVVALGADMPHLPLQLLPLLFLLLIRDKALPMTSRHVIYTVLACLIAVAITGRIWPLQRGHLGALAFFFRPEYHLAILLSAAALTGLFGSGRFFTGLTIAAAFSSLGLVSDPPPNPEPFLRLPFDKQLLVDHYPKIFV